MQPKTVFCSFREYPGHCKRLKYLKKGESSDCQCIKEALLVAYDQDPLLKNAFVGQHVTLQIEDPKKKRLLDLDDDDDLEDGADITILLDPVTQPRIPPPLTPVKISNNALNDHSPELGDNISNNLKVTKPDDEKGNAGEKTEAKEKKTAKPGAHKSMGRPVSGPRIAYPAKLPALTTKLKDWKDQGKVYVNQFKFIEFWCVPLREMTDGYLSTEEWNNYCQTIVETFPELSDDKTGNKWVVLKGQMQRHVCNDRYQSKLHAAGPSKKREFTLEEVNRAVKKAKGDTLSRQRSLGLESMKDTDEAFTELKKCKDGDDSDHVKRLLLETKALRREWINGTAETVAEIIGRFPQLECYSLVINEMLLIIEKEKLPLLKALEERFRKVGLLFKIEAKNESAKADIVLKLYERLRPKAKAKAKKVNEPLITVKEAGRSTQELLTAEGSSARLVMYVAAGRLAEAFVVADGVRIRIPDPGVAKSVLCLMATYYAWHRKYPTDYFHTLQYFDQQILGCNIKQKRLDLFNRDVNNAVELEIPEDQNSDTSNSTN